jgi:leader peptidase (prepilin peptidase)/N-methyltransferase
MPFFWSAGPRLRRLIAISAIAASVLGAVSASVLAVPGLPGVLGAGLATVMIAIAVVDARHFIIPDPLILAGLGLGFVNSWVANSEFGLAAIASSALRGLVFALAFLGLRELYLRIRKREGIGLGDVKLAAVAGVWLDSLTIALVVDVAALGALAVVAIRALQGQQITGKTPVPFGLFFGPAIWLGWFVDVSILQKVF